MKKETFLNKLKLTERLRDELDHVVWRLFKKYIEENKINFSSPSSWNLENDVVCFSGSDGCRGCYDPMYLEIPFNYFEDNYE